MLLTPTHPTYFGQCLVTPNFTAHMLSCTHISMYTPTHTQTHTLSQSTASTPAVVHPMCLHSLLNEADRGLERQGVYWMDRPWLFVWTGFPVLTGNDRKKCRETRSKKGKSKMKINKTKGVYVRMMKGDWGEGDISKEKVMCAHRDMCPAVQISQKKVRAGLESQSPLLCHLSHTHTPTLPRRSQIRSLS